jgi:GNAT superfamily N-acetyltransferase
VARAGVGSQLLEAAEGWASAQGHRCLTLSTGAARRRARTFYEAKGYREEDVKLTRLLR